MSINNFPTDMMMLPDSRILFSQSQILSCVTNGVGDFSRISITLENRKLLKIEKTSRANEIIVGTDNGVYFYIVGNEFESTNENYVQ